MVLVTPAFPDGPAILWMTMIGAFVFALDSGQAVEASVIVYKQARS